MLRKLPEKLSAPFNLASDTFITLQPSRWIIKTSKLIFRPKRERKQNPFQLIPTPTGNLERLSTVDELSGAVEPHPRAHNDIVDERK
jgi:hypothetical protein